MAWKTDDAYVVCEILAAELCAQAYLVALLQELLLQFHVAEGTACLVARGGEVIVEVSRSQLNREQVAFNTRTTYNKGDMVGRTRRRTERLNLLDTEWDKFLGVEQSLGLLIKVCLVGRATALGDEEEIVLHAVVGGKEVNLRRKVGAGVDFLVHIQRHILGVAQVVLRVAIVRTAGDILGIVVARPHLLALVGNADCGTCVLAERKHALCCNAGVLEHGEGHELVVVRSFRVLQNLGDLRRVGRAQAEFNFFKSGLGNLGERLGGDLQNLLAFEFGDGNAIFTEVHVFGSIFTVLDGCFVFECHSSSQV